MSLHWRTGSFSAVQYFFCFPNLFSWNNDQAYEIKAFQNSFLLIVYVFLYFVFYIEYFTQFQLNYPVKHKRHRENPLMNARFIHIWWISNGKELYRLFIRFFFFIFVVVVLFSFACSFHCFCCSMQNGNWCSYGNHIRYGEVTENNKLWNYIIWNVFLSILVHQ